MPKSQTPSNLDTSPAPVMVGLLGVRKSCRGDSKPEQEVRIRLNTKVKAEHLNSPNETKAWKLVMKAVLAECEDLGNPPWDQRGKAITV